MAGMLLAAFGAVDCARPPARIGTGNIDPVLLVTHPYAGGTAMNRASTHPVFTRRGMLRAIAGTATAATLAACSGTRSNDQTATAALRTPQPALATPAGSSGIASAPAVTPNANGSNVVAPAKRITVAATTTQIQDYIANIGGTRVVITGILKPNVDPHDCEPTVEDANTIARADIIFVHGIGLDSWLDKTIKNASAKAPVVKATEGITALQGDEEEPDGDPHVWFDPTLVQTMVTNIANALAKVDSGGASVYQQNAKAYMTQLSQMDTQVQGIFNQVPKEQRKLVTNHDAFQYLANH
jgi:ABC-type Zn uptake system ZnuABC Zn-binding protein ZnuA